MTLSQPPKITTSNALQGLRDGDTPSVTGAGRGAPDLLSCPPGRSLLPGPEALNLQSLSFNGKDMQFICQIKGSLAVQGMLRPTPLPGAEQGPDDLCILNLICTYGALGWLPMWEPVCSGALFCGHFCLQGDRRACVCVWHMSTC